MNPKRILVVDDEPHITHVVSLKLSNAGYEVQQAHDGEEAFEIACKGSFDLVISDVQMPYMDGIQLCIAMQEKSATRELPVILLTARGYAVESTDIERTNIVDVMTKPFSPRNILERVQQIIGPPADVGDSETEKEAA